MPEPRCKDCNRRLGYTPSFVEGADTVCMTCFGKRKPIQSYSYVIRETTAKAMEIAGGLDNMLNVTGLRTSSSYRMKELMQHYCMWLEIDHRYKFTATPELDSEGFTAAVSPWIGLWEAKMALDKEAEQCAKAFWSMFDAPALAPVVDLRNIAFLAEHEAKHLAAGVLYNAVEDARVNKLITDTLGDSTFRYTNPFEGAPVLDQPQQRKLHDMLPPFCENCWGYHHPSESCCFEKGAKARERLDAINWERALEASHQRVQRNLRAGRAE